MDTAFGHLQYSRRNDVWRDEAVLAGEADEFGAGEKFRRAAFIIPDMRVMVAQNAAKGGC
jgi:hypothetical protein